MSAETWAVWCPSCNAVRAARVKAGDINVLLHDGDEHVALVKHSA